MTLSSLGWNDFLANAYQPFSTGDFVPARVALEHKHAYQLLSIHGELTAACTGKLLHETSTRADLPAVGDWVVARPRPGEWPAGPGQRKRADIHAVLPRQTKFSRRAAGDTGTEQIVAANVDTMLLVTALDQNFNLRRIERYLAVTWESGAEPVVVLNKADLHPDPAAARAEVESISSNAAVITLSARCGESLDALTPWLVPGRTLALLGSSGVGKSTIINRLLGVDHMATRTISDAVGKGRHTTTHRELIVTPGGALVIDTPGMRELQLWEVEPSSIDTAFSDIAALAARCRFRDCQHNAEPGCAIRQSLDDGSLELDRWQSYQKLQREQAYETRRSNPQLERETRNEWKKIHKQARANMRMKLEDW
jgi:ribosome biogenesis GTPase / thiamine phosphate phosphatase